MTKLVIIADDLTGALDTCVQFAKWGASVRVVTAGEDTPGNGVPGGAEDVLVIDAETRRLSPGQAYTLTHALVQKALAGGVAHIYIKADSGLRGNVGSGLQAALDAAGLPFIAFLPAFPKMNRITKDGVQFIDGVPLHKSVFAQDPYDPVSSPDVKGLFAGLPARVALLPVGDTYHTDFDRQTIGVFDAGTTADFHRIARHLAGSGQLRVVAGCAGFAGVLPAYVGMPRRQVTVPPLGRSLLVFCGSLSPITRRQIEYGERMGYRRLTLTPQQQMEDSWIDSAQGDAWLEANRDAFAVPGVVMVETGIACPERTEAYLAQLGIDREETRSGIPRRLGRLIRRILERGYGDDSALMVTGGDTMMGFMQQVGWREITPVGELEPGAVLSRVQCDMGGLWVISKSGGFGGEDLLERIAIRIRGGEENAG